MSSPWDTHPRCALSGRPSCGLPKSQQEIRRCGRNAKQLTRKRPRDMSTRESRNVKVHLHYDGAFPLFSPALRPGLSREQWPGGLQPHAGQPPANPHRQPPGSTENGGNEHHPAEGDAAADHNTPKHSLRPSARSRTPLFKASSVPVKADPSRPPASAPAYTIFPVSSTTKTRWGQAV